MNNEKRKKSSILIPGKLPAQLLGRLIAKLPNSDAAVVVPPGIGRDAAGIKIGKRLFGVTTDPVTFATKRIATYSVYINMNDLACLGCRPRWYLGTLLLPSDTSEKVVKNIWQELVRVLQKNHLQSIGGHVEVTDAVTRPVLVGQMIGESLQPRLLDPARIKSGDVILLWQKLAIEGTAIIAQEKSRELKRHFSARTIRKMCRLLDTPGINIFPFVEKLLARFRGVVALHDPTEGGIATAIHELADAANCGVTINYDVLPFLPETLCLAKIFHFDPLGLIASGALLIVCRAATANKILEKFKDEPLCLIGSFEKSPQHRILRQHGQSRNLPRFDKDEII